MTPGHTCFQVMHRMTVRPGHIIILQVLALGSNDFSGTVPDALSNLTQLNTLDLTFNNFS